MGSLHSRILVVDDETQITRVLRTALDSHGYDVRVANDGETALEIMKDWSPNLVVTDLAMPNMDGLELCRRLRTGSQVPIIVLSVRGEKKPKSKHLMQGLTTTRPSRSASMNCWRECVQHSAELIPRTRIPHYYPR